MKFTTLTQTQDLNENEFKVLEACAQAIYNESRCQFGYSENVVAEGLTKQQIKGYLSQLIQKRYISIDNDEYAQMMLENKGVMVFDLQHFETCYGESRKSLLLKESKKED